MNPSNSKFKVNCLILLEVPRRPDAIQKIAASEFLGLWGEAIHLRKKQSS